MTLGGFFASVGILFFFVYVIAFCSVVLVVVTIHSDDCDGFKEGCEFPMIT